MLRVARRVERDPSDAWVESLDADVRNAPQTFRLAAELIVVSRRIPQPAGLTISRLTATRPDFSTGPTSQPDDDNSDLIQADRMLAAAQRLYDRDRIGSGRFAIQAIAVRLQRAQLAWFMGDKLAGEKLAAQACDRLPWVDEFHRPTVAQAAATVRAFLLAQTDRPAEARAWLMQTRFANQFSLAGFQAQLGSSWRGALTRQIVAPPAGPADLPTSQPVIVFGQPAVRR
jgi:hypothetical protein